MKSESSTSDRKRELKRQNNRRYQANLRARRTCATIVVGEDGLQALVWCGLLPDRPALLKDEIKQGAQALFDKAVRDELKKFGF